MSIRKVDVVVIGNIVKETIIRPDEIIGPVLGSPCAYTSLALAKLGKKVGIVSYCGNDFWNEIKNELSGVDDSGKINYLYTTENHLIYKTEDQNHVEYFKVAPVINFDVIPEEYLNADIFFLCPMDYEVNVEICEKLWNLNKKIIVDLGGYGGTTSYNHFPVGSNRGNKLIDDLCKYAYMIKASQNDMSYIMPDKSVEECTEYLISKGPKYVVITMGDKGAVCQEAGKAPEFSSSYFNDDKNRNTTGSGDVFTAGVIAAMMEQGHSIQYILAYGNSAASLVLEEKGGCLEKRMPSDIMVKLRMERKI